MKGNKLDKPAVGPQVRTLTLASFLLAFFFFYQCWFLFLLFPSFNHLICTTASIFFHFLALLCIIVLCPLFHAFNATFLPPLLIHLSTPLL